MINTTIELKIDATGYEKHKVEILVDDRLVKCGTVIAFDGEDYCAFEDVIEELRRACINIGRADIATSLRNEISEFTEVCDDEFDSYTRVYLEFEFRNGTSFEVVHGDYDSYENTEYSQLIKFLNEEVLWHADIDLKLSVERG